MIYFDDRIASPFAANKMLATKSWRNGDKIEWSASSLKRRVTSG